MWNFDVGKHNNKRYLGDFTYFSDLQLQQAKQSAYNIIGFYLYLLFSIDLPIFLWRRAV